MSVVSPVFQAEKIVPELVRRLKESLAEITEDYEIVLVEDGSPDESWLAICEECEKEERVKAIQLTRNFGQHFAITAGIEHASGDYVVVMDCDLQDSPSDIVKLYDKALEGYDIVLGRKTQRAHPLHRNVFSGVFFAVFNRLADRQAGTPSFGSFSLISRRAVGAFLRYSDRHRHYLMILRELGMARATVEVAHSGRFEGHSSYTLAKLVSHAVGGVTSQSTRLLKISIGIGVLYFLASVIGILYLVLRFFLSGFQEGWASTMVVLLGSTGLILIAIGIQGIYIGNIFDQVRMRPLYLINESRNLAASQEWEEDLMTLGSSAENATSAQGR